MRNQIKIIAAMFERQVLLFPVIVTLLACTSFLFGGCCSAWQWWASLICVWLCPFLRKEYGAGIGSMFIWLGLFFLYFLFQPFFLDIGYVDEQCYHIPATRLLMEGWNPVVDYDANKILSALELDKWGMRYYHVIFIARAQHVFNAVAYFFFRDPLSVTVPLKAFVALAFFFAAIRTFAKAGWLLGVFVACAGMLLSGLNNHIADKIILFASAGLFLTMLRCLRERDVDVLALFAYSFWMVNVKLPAILACGVFLSLFAFVCIKPVWRTSAMRNRMRKLAALVALLCVTSFVVSFSPYMTAWIHFGHPLYPFQTTDNVRFPVRILTCDIIDGTSGAREMGLWTFLSAYVSPTLALGGFRMTHAVRDKYLPECPYWGHLENGVPCPTTLCERVLIALTLLVLLSHRYLRFFGVGMLVCLISVPPSYYGYLRYVIWWVSCAIVALAVIVERLVARWRATRVFFAVMVGGLILVVMRLEVGRLLNELDYKVDELNPPRQVYGAADLGIVGREEYWRKYDEILGPEGSVGVNTLKLMYREMDMAERVDVLPLENPDGYIRRRLRYAVRAEDAAGGGRFTKIKLAVVKGKVSFWDGVSSAAKLFLSEYLDVFCWRWHQERS